MVTKTGEVWYTYLMSRFLADNETVIDVQTGLMWTKDASMFNFPLSWDEAFTAIKECNRSGLYGYKDWKLPNRKELFSLICHDAINPCLSPPHPFRNVFAGYYWTSTSCARLPNQAWYIHLGGARVFKGMKYGSYMVWAVRRVTEHPYHNRVFHQTGQRKCFNAEGDSIGCYRTGQDGEYQSGLSKDGQRFIENANFIMDQATDLTWLKNANIAGETLDWNSALDFVRQMNRKREYGYSDWRVPGIVELESLTDMGQHSPALPVDHLFMDGQDFYWSSTTSMYDTNYAWVLYLIDGAVGVGYKTLSEFFLWPVRGNGKFHTL